MGLTVASVFCCLMALLAIASHLDQRKRWWYCPECGRCWSELGETSEVPPTRGTLQSKHELCPFCRTSSLGGVEGH